jgi:hypothetical protein
VDLKSFRETFFSSRPFSFDTLDRIHTFYPTHYDLPDCQMYPPSNWFRDGDLVSHILGTHMGDYGGILWYLGKMLDHARQRIPRGCFHV